MMPQWSPAMAGYVAGIDACINESCRFWQFVTENITSCETWPLIEFVSVRRYTDLSGGALGHDFYWNWVWESCGVIMICVSFKSDLFI